MPNRIVVIQFNYDMDDSAVDETAKEFAKAVKDTPGLPWKIWLNNAEAKGTGGVYCFESREAAERYINGPTVKELQMHPSFFSMTIRQYDTIPEAGKLTHSPTEAPAVKAYRQSRTRDQTPLEALRNCLEGYRHPVPSDVMDFQIQLAIAEATDIDFIPEALRDRI